ncbi:hypothetical protein ACFVG1_33025 [Streptomyces bacillaris]|uniref:effector-associated constant component EACC1 n=1 Tax=Streptomyces bacillaris TaxID=68179 RepID=UPI0035D963E3
MDYVGIAIAAGLGGLVSTLARLLIAWVRSRHPTRARMRVGGREVNLNLSNPDEAAEYLKRLRK